MAGRPQHLEALVERFDHEVMDVPGGKARIRMEIRGHGTWDVLIEGRKAKLKPPTEDRPDALLSADPPPGQAIAKDTRGGIRAGGQGPLSIRHNMHLGVGLLAATSGNKQPGRLEFKRAQTRAGSISY